MDALKQQIQLRMIANVITDKCAHSTYLLFRESWCSQERVIRFTTPFFRKLFSIRENGSGQWKTGDAVMYEASNQVGSFTVYCVLSPDSVRHEASGEMERLLKVMELEKSRHTGTFILKSWDLTPKNNNVNSLFTSFDELLEKEIPSFENNILEKLEKEKKAQFMEGAAQQYELTRYERNQEARRVCIAANGSACKVCGIDFGKAYGPEFEGKIEVHHIIPISEIGEKYVIDPVNDLVPVCPNCHTALHSKKNGVYTVEELRTIREHREMS